MPVAVATIKLADSGSNGASVTMDLGATRPQTESGTAGWSVQSDSEFGKQVRDVQRDEGKLGHDVAVVTHFILISDMDDIQGHCPKGWRRDGGGFVPNLGTQHDGLLMARSWRPAVWLPVAWQPVV